MKMKVLKHWRVNEKGVVDLQKKRFTLERKKFTWKYQKGWKIGSRKNGIGIIYNRKFHIIRKMAVGITGSEERADTVCIYIYKLNPNILVSNESGRIRVIQTIGLGARLSTRAPCFPPLRTAERIVTVDREAWEAELERLDALKSTNTEGPPGQRLPLFTDLNIFLNGRFCMTVACPSTMAIGGKFTSQSRVKRTARSFVTGAQRLEERGITESLCFDCIRPGHAARISPSRSICQVCCNDPNFALLSVNVKGARLPTQGHCFELRLAKQEIESVPRRGAREIKLT
ncbi:unnamed protein product [Trichogramma brassicae]|uniref:Uncharacterized protein n=1 Tax=Trichogramma brassicae TaxID=86971 RepID=A0A6H5IYP9_9HYME|nr:unnamed protein product [Trichogramma brassicae]